MLKKGFCFLRDHDIAKARIVRRNVVADPPRSPHLKHYRLFVHNWKQIAGAETRYEMVMRITSKYVENCIGK